MRFHLAFARLGALLRARRATVSDNDNNNNNNNNVYNNNTALTLLVQHHTTDTLRHVLEFAIDVGSTEWLATFSDL